SVIPQLDKILLEEMKNNNQVHTGMLPKLENAFDATTHDVEVMIGHALSLEKIISGQAGTRIVHAG
ncbi:MAG: acetylglutamate kinase, partial [Ferruginibacter sp.]